MIRRRLIRQLKALIDYVKQNNPGAPDKVILYIISANILGFALGPDWAQRVVFSDGGTRFFRPEHSDPHDLNLRVFRIYLLAEMIINFEGTPSFRNLLNKLRNADPESIFTEMEVAKLLFLSRVDFRFNDESGVKGLDYDLLLQKAGQLFSADTKCKIEDNNCSSKTILNSLKQARSQLRKDLPGIVFVGLPQTWHDVRSLNEKPDVLAPNMPFVDLACEQFFGGLGNYGGTRHVVLVVAYFNLVLNGNQKVQNIYLVKEYPNPNHRFLINEPLNLCKKMNGDQDWFHLISLCFDEAYFA
jgi:hypothetical protein